MRAPDEPCGRAAQEVNQRGKDILEEFAEAQGKATQEGIEAEVKAQRGIKTAEKPGGAPKPEKFDVGNFAHDYAEELIAEDKLPRGLDKEVEIRLPDGGKNRLDRVDRKNGIIYELKPDTPSQVKAGENQLKLYIEYMNREQPLGGGRKWQCKVVTYGRDTVVQLLKKIGWLK